MSEPAKYRKKPVVIEAMQWTGRNYDEAETFITIEFGYQELPDETGAKVIIPTLEGEMTADVGDWIIKGVQGEFYPCKPAIFEATYEPEEPMSQSLDRGTSPEEVIREALTYLTGWVEAEAALESLVKERDRLRYRSAEYAAAITNAETLAQENKQLSFIVESYVASGPTNPEAREMWLDAENKAHALETELNQLRSRDVELEGLVKRSRELSGPVPSAEATETEAAWLDGNALAHRQFADQLSNILHPQEPTTETCPTCGWTEEEYAFVTDDGKSRPCTNLVFHTPITEPEKGESG